MCSGASLGALLMYLFDPDKGAKRREHLSEMTGEALEGTGKAIGTGWDTLRSKADEYGHIAAERVGEWGGGMSRHTSDLGKKGRKIARDTSHRLGSFVRSHHDVGAERLGLKSDLSQVVAAVGLLALGAGLMYVFDPIAGRRRRALARDKALHGYHEVSDQVSKVGRDLRNRAVGTMHDVRSRLHRERADDRVLHDRVRSEIGRCVSNPSAIDVRVSGGTVTLSGPILSRDVDSLLKCVWSVYGVKDLINQLEAHETPENIPALQGTTSRSGNIHPMEGI